MVVPIPLRSYLMDGDELTTLGRLLCYLVVVDENAEGSIVNLGLCYLVYMGLLAVFCTNAINIYAHIYEMYTKSYRIHESPQVKTT